MANQQGFEAALAVPPDEHTIQGRLLTVKPAEPLGPAPHRPERFGGADQGAAGGGNDGGFGADGRPGGFGGGSGGGSGGGGPRPDSAFKIFVGGIAQGVGTPELREYFLSFGSVVDAVVMSDRATGRSRCFGFVTMEDEASYRAVLGQEHEMAGKFFEVKQVDGRK
mmetsp:Transcript_12683/g.29842  ORF Transcript_12683/g.29842 Transcript_12683/m.29842 type:complete len:166 (-) Transcript_12683:312-809(-)